MRAVRKMKAAKIGKEKDRKESLFLLCPIHLNSPNILKALNHLKALIALTILNNREDQNQ
ncbi:hypothetical protein A2548_01670 [candidate division WOR-1 bacterium RIFOXYD2_FULL_41_8]|uniref:Uncharacterized protein n=1 Tax=candidate division WOR-1 bacterium RIFOXYC2_FULL_41_25 TaxID=1802586 RepID=A0A1F4TIZ0_UNCSA|nr:MAG: hypothetical protein A2462_03980 [candidate division WOR-1 bacterium RIFOXYC2_FULL_41_25]OGC41554.1 MAG: hypothetical protein A2548_01670 [candidate division WOR-1 bacterium RIFOXYD2_FULL_41_8]